MSLNFLKGGTGNKGHQNVKNFMFEWYTNVNPKYGPPIVRTTYIKGGNMQSAALAFKQAFGSLRKNTINFIQEVNSNGEPIGEKVIPKKDDLMFEDLKK